MPSQRRKRRRKSSVERLRKAHAAKKCPAGTRKLKTPKKEANGRYRHCTKPRRKKSKRKSPRRSKGKGKGKRKSPRKSKRKRRRKSSVERLRKAHAAKKCPKGTRKLKTPKKEANGRYRHCTKPRRKKSKRKSPRRSKGKGKGKRKSPRKSRKKRRNKAEMERLRKAHREKKCPAGTRKLKKPTLMANGRYRHCTKPRRKKSKRKSPRKSKRKRKSTPQGGRSRSRSRRSKSKSKSRRSKSRLTKAGCRRVFCNKTDTWRKCYLKAARKHHPDKGGNEENFKRLNNCNGLF